LNPWRVAFLRSVSDLRRSPVLASFITHSELDGRALQKPYSIPVVPRTPPNCPGRGMGSTGLPAVRTQLPKLVAGFSKSRCPGAASFSIERPSPRRPRTLPTSWYTGFQSQPPMEWPELWPTQVGTAASTSVFSVCTCIAICSTLPGFLNVCGSSVARLSRSLGPLSVVPRA
jgi:hypothetical protein